MVDLIDKAKDNNLILKLVFLFLIFSAVGRLYEFDLVISTGSLNYVKDFPTSIYTLIFATPYGISGLILYLLIKNLNKNKFTKNAIVKTLICVAVVDLIELGTGLLAVKLLGVMPWDYSFHFMNYRGLISFPITIRWAIFVIIFDKLVFEKAKHFIEKPLSEKIKKITIATLIVYAVYLTTIITLKSLGIF